VSRDIREYKNRSREMSYYNSTDTCDGIKEDGIRCGKDFHGKAYKEKDKNGNWIGSWICSTCYRQIKNYGTTDTSVMRQIKSTYKRPKRYNKGNICDICAEKGIITKLYAKNAFQEYNKDGKYTERWMCKSCYAKNHYRENIGSMTARRLGNQNIDHSNTKGDKGQKLLNVFKGWKDLNKENDDYNSPIDSIDQKGLLHQVRTKWYDPYNKIWLFGNLKNELF
jgi:ribosomal protein L34E